MKLVDSDGHFVSTGAYRDITPRLGMIGREEVELPTKAYVKLLAEDMSTIYDASKESAMYLARRLDEKTREFNALQDKVDDLEEIVKKMELRVRLLIG